MNVYVIVAILAVGGFGHKYFYIGDGCSDGVYRVQKREGASGLMRKIK